MNSKSKKIKSKNIKYNKLNKHNKLNKNNLNKTKKIIKIIKNKKGGNLTNINEAKGSIDTINKQYSNDEYRDVNMFDFMKIKTQGVYLKPGVEMPPAPCSIS
jgi:hypothetical protein